MSNAKKILVTGASGLLGLELLGRLNDGGFNAVGTFNSNPQLTEKSYKNFKCDISDVRSVDFLASKIGKVNLIFHCAAMASIDRCEKDKAGCWRANVIGTRNMVDLAKKNNAKLVYISTGSVFSGEKGNYKEDDVPEPKNLYSWTKLLGEEAVLTYDSGIVVRVVPIGIHSIDRPQANFIEWLVDSVRNNKSFNLFKDVYINPISAESFAKILLKIPKVLEKGVIHIGSKNKLSKAEIGQAVIAKFPDFSGEVKLISVDDMPGGFASRPKEMWLNVDKALLLGFDLPEALSDLEAYLNGKKLL